MFLFLDDVTHVVDCGLVKEMRLVRSWIIFQSDVILIFTEGLTRWAIFRVFEKYSYREHPVDSGLEGLVGLNQVSQ